MAPVENEKPLNDGHRQRRPIPGDEESGTVYVGQDSADGIIDFNTHAERHHTVIPDTQGLIRFWARFTRKGRPNITVLASLQAIALSSWLNLFVIFIPLAWISHWVHWSSITTFILCFLAIVPMEQLFEFGGEQMALYVGAQLGDLIIITLNNAVEATLAIILLEKQSHCELRLLQSTIIGVVILHLLLLPGTAFITGGARIWEQNLHPHLTQLNNTLLMIGVMSLLLPTAFFAALDRGGENIATDDLREKFLQMSRGVAVFLLVVYFCSRVFLHNPPGEDNALALHPDAPEELRHEEHRLANTEPEVNQYICIIMLLCAITVVAVTAEFLVESIEFVREGGRMQEPWFGLILLPLVSFAADGSVAILFFGRYLLKIFFGTPPPPATLARARAIDLSIQFLNFWLPLLVLLAWWTNKPFHLLFDLFEVALLIGAVFIVNYVTADAKTNWAEGVTLVAFYGIIALCSWYYPGQEAVKTMLSCSSITEALAIAASGAGEHAAEGR